MFRFCAQVAGSNQPSPVGRILMGYITAIRPVVLFAREHANAADEMGLEEGYQERTILFYTTYALEDQKEGMQTFIEKLEPDFENTQWLVVVKIYDNS
jgi:1,4-dihydroxy-2-naphthoyl-CoA synthase